MGLGRHVWRARARIVGDDRVVIRRQVQEIGLSGALSRRGRARLDALLVRELVAGPARLARVRVGDALVEIGGGDDFPVDWKAFVEIFADRPYDAPFDGASVLDVGAHKGYFGAFALAAGAAVVASFEPATRNFSALERAAAPFGERWRTRHCALGRASGSTTLFLDETSWAHSLVAVKRPAGEERVDILGLEDALAELPTGERTIVKIDAEGSECDILAHPGPLERVDVLMVEWHPALAPSTTEELIGTIESGGLGLVTHTGGVMRFARS